jgi:hypothetical protein
VDLSFPDSEFIRWRRQPVLKRHVNRGKLKPD